MNTNLAPLVGKFRKSFLAKCQLLLALSCCLAVGRSFAADDILWGGSDGYWSDPAGWAAGSVPTGDSSEGAAVVNAQCTVTITNGDSIASHGFAVRGKGVVKMSGGRWENTRDDDTFYVSSTDNSQVGTLEVYDGELYLNGNMMVGRYGVGTFSRYGGSTSVKDWLCLGQRGGSLGRAALLGGSIVQRTQNEDAGMVVGNSGTGECLIGGTADVTVNGAKGVWFGRYDTSVPTNSLALAKGGSLSVKRLSSGTAGTRVFLFDGGTLRTTADAAALVTDGSSGARTLSEFSVTDRGGVVDTCGNSVTVNQPLTASSAASKANLVHRWSFNGDARDSIGGTSAAISGSASLEAKPGSVAIPGGAHGTSTVDLGSGLIPTGSEGFTVEVWGTLVEESAWAMCFEIGSRGSGGSRDALVFAWLGSAAGKGGLYGPTLDMYYSDRVNAYSRSKFEVGKEYHVAVTFSPTGDGGWTVTCWRQEAGTGRIENVVSMTAPSGWSPSLQNASKFLLGTSLASDADGNCMYNEVRIWDRPLSEDEIVLNDVAGPDVVDGSFVKKGAGTLTLTGENTFAAPVRIEAGTLALAAGATLAEDCDVTVATNTVLSLASGAYPRGGVVVEVDEYGCSGCIASTDTLDLSQLSISIANPSALSKEHRYTIVTSTGGFTGTLPPIELPPKWVWKISGNRLTVSYPHGLTIVFK